MMDDLFIQHIQVNKELTDKILKLYDEGKLVIEPAYLIKPDGTKEILHFSFNIKRNYELLQRSNGVST